MSASLQLDGVKELRDALERLPDTFAQQELGPIVLGAAEGMASEIKATYAKNDGVLADRVIVEKGADARGLLAKVRSKAPHSHLYEYGTVKRFTNETGANRGTMPARPVLVPAAIRWRARMVTQTKAALQRMQIPGFSGSAEVRES